MPQSGLADKHAFLKLGNDVARFDFIYCDMSQIAPDFLPRSVADDELSFDPLTLKKRPKPKPNATSTVLPSASVVRQDPEDTPYSKPQKTRRSRKAKAQRQLPSHRNQPWRSRLQLRKRQRRQFGKPPKLTRKHFRIRHCCRRLSRLLFPGLPL